MYMAMAVIFITIFLDLDPAKSFPMHQAGRAATQPLAKLVEAHVKAVNMPGWIAGLVDGIARNHTPVTDYGVSVVRKLLDSGLGASEITWSQILPSAGAMVANQAQVVRHSESCLGLISKIVTVHPITGLLSVR